MALASPPLQLAFGAHFDHLHSSAGLHALHNRFLATLTERSPELAARLRDAYAAPDRLDAKAESALIIAVAPELDLFIAKLFGIEAEVATLRSEHNALAPLFSLRRHFVQRRAANRYNAELPQLDGAALNAALEQRFAEPLTEASYTQHVTHWLSDETANAESLEMAARYAAWAIHTDAGRAKHSAGVLFKIPHKLDPQHLIPAEQCERDGVREFRLPANLLRRRDGFALTDRGTNLAGALGEAHYCIWCHEQGKDSCSKGLRDKAKDAGAAPFKKSSFGVALAGCPLEEKISEFHMVKTEGWAIGALAIIVIDNPLCAGTGHRICNDCMKACIYQKQEPVNIPEAETRSLKDVLALPWGFEIYSLLTRWNPVNIRRPVARTASGKRVLVVGLGPAGSTLSHHLLNDGHAVVAIDGLKIEPLPGILCGRDDAGHRVAFEPIRDLASWMEPLQERHMAGFGGVAEYGITVRWDKNFLKVLRLLLQRRENFAMFGGVRFGGTLNVDEAFALGFDHIALAAGAGRPTILEMPHGLARGVRAASDFLMALQLTGAAKSDSIANMQLRLPVVVIGGGLTAIDTATEALAYYPVQVEKYLHRHEALAESGRGGDINQSAEENEIAAEFLDHARAIRAERAAAAAEGRTARILELLHSWGGVRVAYRRRMIDSPSYTLNHEEVHKALEEGIGFAEGLTPLAIYVDQYGAAAAIRLQRQERDAEGNWHATGEVTLPARTVLVAAGTQPNTILAREEPHRFKLDGKYFQACDTDGNPVRPERSAKPSRADVFLHRAGDGRMISFFGDLHPSFFGNVVKAMAAARAGYPSITTHLARRPPASRLTDADFIDTLRDLLTARVHAVNRLTDNIVEVIVHAPLAARHFHPGQFYRLQNFEAQAPRSLDTTLAMEGLALTGAWVDRERGLVSTIALEMGGSADLCALLKPGESVVLMGPTGTPTEIPAHETVLLAGGGLGNAVLFSIGQALRASGSKVLYFAGYKHARDRYKVDEIERAADVVIWCCDEAPGFTPTRAQDRAVVGNIVECIHAYASGRLGTPEIALSNVDRIIAIGSDRMMAAVARARHGILRGYLKPEHEAIGSINSPMQCMMKEICAQCLQPHIDPVTGARSYVFSCFNQDQPLDRVDFDTLNQRLKQNAVQEKLTARWIARCLEQLRA
jgi:NADPH-dependent glutamate synthase beta subunit-like oxidoreductase/NAD(P)H-flavin reductase